MTMSQAKKFYLFLTVFGLILASFVNFEFFLIGVLSVFLSYIYAKEFKKQPYIGNVIVSILSVLTIFAGMIAIGRINLLGIYLIIIALFGSISREIIKDIEDIKGDKENKAKTLPIVFGTNFAKFLAILNIIIASFFALRISIILCLLYISSIPVVLIFKPSFSQRYMKILMLITVLFVFFSLDFSL
jgi:4-hydroxybenzoate polyprenyltransferase